MTTEKKEPVGHVIRFTNVPPPYTARCETCGACWMTSADWVRGGGCAGRLTIEMED